MADKKTFKKLISKGLSGKEAGLLAFRDSWEVDHGRPELLSESDFEKMKAGLVERQDIASYNRMIDAYRAVDYTSKIATIISLEITNRLQMLYHVGQSYLTHNSVKMARLSQPVVMTEKQYQEMSARQREKKLQETWSLYEASLDRAMEMATEQQKEESDYDPAELVQLYPDLGDEAAMQVLKALPADFTFEGDGLDEIMARQRDKTGNLSTEDAADLLLEAELTGEQLYQTGLPEFVEWMDKYKPGLYEDDPYGSRDVAILLAPDPDILDENGYYTGTDGLKWLEKITKRSLFEDEEGVQALVSMVRDSIKVFLAIMELFQALSDVLDFDLMEDINQLYSDIEDSVSLYNSAASPKPPLQYFPPEWKLSAISLARLKPDKKEIEHLRDRMAMSFGEGWWTSSFGGIQESFRDAVGTALEKSLYAEEGDDGQKA